MKAKTSLKPCGYYVIVVPDTFEKEVKEGALEGFQLVAGSDAEKIEKGGRMVGTLAAIGPQAWQAHAHALGKALDEEPWAEVGDRVMYSRYAGKTWDDPVHDCELYILRDDDIIAILPREEADHE